MQQEITFAIVGCGRIGLRHAEHIATVGKLIAVADVDEFAAKQLATQYNCSHYNSIEDLLNNQQPQVMAICTPNGLHAIHAITALQKGCHVVCEKPMAITVAHCHAMIAAASKAQKQLFVVKQNRFNPPVAAVKKAIDENRLGNLLSFQMNCFWNRNDDYYANNWRGTKQLDGGTLFTQFSHFIDLIYWLLGDVKAVQAITKNFLHQNSIEFEDSGVVMLEMPNGAIGTINYSVNSHQKNMEGSLTILGSKGTVKIGGEYLNTLEYALVQDYDFGILPQGNLPNNYGTYKGSMSNHDKVYKNVVDVLQHNGVIATTAEEGLKTVEIIEKIYSAAQNPKL